MSNYNDNKGTGLRDFEYSLFSPKDDLDYYSKNPLQYLNVVSSHLAAGELKTYSLSELVKVEDQFKTAYSSLSDEQKNEYLYACSDAVGQLFDLKVEKTEGNKNKGLIVQNFLSPKDSSADYLNPLDYINVVKESIAAGKMDTYSLAELQEVEDKCKEAYARLSDKKKEIYMDDCVETIMDLSKLYVKEDKRLDKEYQIVADLSNDLMDNADEGIETILYDHALELNKNKPQDNNLDYAEITVEEQEIDAQELNDIITLEDMGNLLADYNPKDFAGFAPGKYVVTSLQKNASKDYCVTYKPFKKRILNYRGADMVKESKVFNDGYDLDLSALRLFKEQPVIEYDVDVSEFYVDAPKKKLENIVAAFPSQKKSKAISFLAKAAMLVGLATPFMCNSYIPTNQSLDDASKQDYAAAEVASPMTSAKASAQAPETKKVEKEAPSTIAPKIAVFLPQKKVVKRFPPSYNSQAGNYHAIEKGDTLAGLYEDYVARGGMMSRSDYFKTIRMANPQIENISTIYAGQVVQEPSN